MSEKLMVAGIVPESIVDGRGIRYTVFVQGCPHHCPGCHNPETHPFEGGTPMEVEEIFDEFQKNPILKGITFSGGEPFCQAEVLAQLARLVHKAGKDVTVYSGWTYEALSAMEDEGVKALLEETDMLVDGPYLKEQRNLELSFRGSENQRLINMKRTRAEGSPVLFED